MTELSKDALSLFLGQSVAFDGTALTQTLAGVCTEQLVEMPVAEELQLGMSIGLSLEGFEPVCIYPRFNFLMRAMDQLVNHLDRLSLYSESGYNPKVIIRTAIGRKTPIDAGPQHGDDFTQALRQMLLRTRTAQLLDADGVTREYGLAKNSIVSTVLVEDGNCY